jgi:radical SAM superfamily enzyme YgiQ (UPF0313 family)
MKILLVYPRYPDTYWSFKHALRFIRKKAAVPPLGLITVAALLPKNWHKKLIDMNVEELKDHDIRWADYVFISAMYVQKESVAKVIERCIASGTKTVAGGPLFTQEYPNYPDIDHFILNEAELTLAPFIKALEQGEKPERIYKTTAFANMHQSPIPEYGLLKLNAYVFMSFQVSRGCPFACNFCEITALLGHKVRMKTSRQIIQELETLHQLNWRGSVSVVDDNFIGNLKSIKTDLLPTMISWTQKHKYPFHFNAQTSINMADDAELLELMAQAGFNAAFIGIETPSGESLQYCNKVQNQNRNLLDSVHTIQQAGIQVSGGFIVGFDTDKPDVFERQIEFIQKSGIVSAMVGLLNAPKNTKLYRQLEIENRITTEATGSNTDYSMNFIPKMDADVLLEGYRSIIRNIYSVKPYYQRVRQLLLNYRATVNQGKKIKSGELLAFLKSMLILGIMNKGQLAYWKLLIWTFFKRPALLPDAITFAVYGYHYRAVYKL